MSDAHNAVPTCTEAIARYRSVTDILARIGDKWTVMVVGALSRRSLRYNEVRRLVGGISQRMLTLTLKGLEQDGFVTRTVFPTIPPRVDYELTDLGQQLLRVLQPVYEFALAHQPEMAAARERFAASRTAVGVAAPALAVIPGAEPRPRSP